MSAEDSERGDEFTPVTLAVSLAAYPQEQFFPETAAAWGRRVPAVRATAMRLWRN
jgi:hypothetical protein